MIPLAVPNISGAEGRYLAECVETTMVSTVGPFVGRFETLVANAAGLGCAAAATSAGTTGLHAAFAAVGVTQGDLVASPSFTFIASANAISHAGAAPWLFDVTEESWTLDPEQLAAALERDAERTHAGAVIHKPTGRRIAAIAPVYTMGCPADLDALTPIARAWALPIVVDAAAALGAELRGRPIAEHGADLAVFSFNGNKTITAGGGGAVVGRAGPLIERVRHLTTTARSGPDYDHDAIGFNYRMTNLQAAVGCAQMERLAAFLAAKRRIDARYRAELPRPGFPQPLWATSACWFSGAVLESAAEAEALRAELRAAGIDARPFWKPVHLQKPYASAPAEPTPVTDGLWRRVLPLPCSTHLTETEQSAVIDAVRSAEALGSAHV